MYPNRVCQKLHDEHRLDRRVSAGKLAEQLTPHVQMEEGVLVPLMQDSMDSDTEERLHTACVIDEVNI